TLDQLCRHFAIHERPTRVMMTLFRSMGLVARVEDRFTLTDLSREFLVASSPRFLGPYYAPIQNRPVCRDMLAVLKSGRPANWSSFEDQDAWARAMEAEAFATEFTSAMDARGTYLGQVLADTLACAGRSRLLDIAGGSGIYACALAAR